MTTYKEFYSLINFHTKKEKLKEELNLISIGDIEVKYKMSFFKKKIRLFQSFLI